MLPPLFPWNRLIRYLQVLAMEAASGLTLDPLPPPLPSLVLGGVGGRGDGGFQRLTDRVRLAFFCVHFLPRTLFFGENHGDTRSADCRKA